MEAAAFFGLILKALPPATAAWARAREGALLPMVQEALEAARPTPEESPRPGMVTVGGKLPDRSRVNAADLAADYKARGIARSASYSQFVRDRVLRPEMDAKAFFALYDAATPALLPREGGERVRFVPTHWDTVIQDFVMIRPDARGVRDMVWATGITGSEPPGYPLDANRYRPLAEGVGERAVSAPAPAMRPAPTTADPYFRPLGADPKPAKRADALEVGDFVLVDGERRTVLSNEPAGETSVKVGLVAWKPDAEHGRVPDEPRFLVKRWRRESSVPFDGVDTLSLTRLRENQERSAAWERRREEASREAARRFNEAEEREFRAQERLRPFQVILDSLQRQDFTGAMDPIRLILGRVKAGEQDVESGIREALTSTRAWFKQYYERGDRTPLYPPWLLNMEREHDVIAPAPAPAPVPPPEADGWGLKPGDVLYTKKLGIPYPGKNVGTVGMDHRGRIWHLTDEMKQARMRVQSASYDLGQKLLAAIGIKTEQPTVAQLQEAMTKAAADLQEHWLYDENRPPGIGIELPNHTWPVEYVTGGISKGEWRKHHPNMTYTPMGEGEMGLRHVLEEATSNGRRSYRVGVWHYEKVTQGSGSWVRPVWFLMSSALKPPVEMIPRAERQKQAGSPQSAIIQAFRALGWREDAGGRYTYLTHPADHWRLQLRERSVHSGYREGGIGKWSEGHSQGTLKEFAKDPAGYAAHYHKLAEEKAVKVKAKRQAAVEVGAPAPVSEATGKPQAPKGKLLVYHTPEEGTVVRGVPRPAPPWMKEALHSAGLFGARSVRDLWYVPRSRGLAQSPIDLEALGKALGQVEEAAEDVAELESVEQASVETPLAPTPAAFPDEHLVAVARELDPGDVVNVNGVAWTVTEVARKQWIKGTESRHFVVRLRAADGRLGNLFFSGEGVFSIGAFGDESGVVVPWQAAVRSIEVSAKAPTAAPTPAPPAEAPFVPTAEQALAAVKRINSAAREQQASAWMAGWYAGRARDSYAASPVVDRKFWQAGWYAGRGDA